VRTATSCSSITFNSTPPFTVRNLDSCFHSRRLTPPSPRPHQDAVQRALTPILMLSCPLGARCAPLIPQLHSVPHAFRNQHSSAIKGESDRFSIADNGQGHSLIGLVTGRPLSTNPVHLTVNWQVSNLATLRPSGKLSLAKYTLQMGRLPDPEGQVPSNRLLCAVKHGPRILPVLPSTVWALPCPPS
jgi:hypothetical protein